MTANRKTVDKLTLGHWNANGIRGNSRELSQFLWDHNVDIMFINETRLTPKNQFYMAGYNVVRKERIGNKTQGGVQILIKDNINYIEVNLNIRNIESVAIKLCYSTVLASVYNPPNAKLNLRELESILRTGNKET